MHPVFLTAGSPRINGLKLPSSEAATAKGVFRMQKPARLIPGRHVTAMSTRRSRGLEGLRRHGKLRVGVLFYALKKSENTVPR